MKKTLIISMLFIAFVFVFNSHSFASSLYVEYNEVYTGEQPQGETPWLTALFEDVGIASVLLTLRAPNLVQWEFTTGWYFNFNPEKDVDALVFEHVGGLAPAADDEWDYTELDGFNQAGACLLFDIKIPYDTAFSKRFTAGLFSQFMITGLEDLVAADFNYRVLKNDELFISVAHIQGIGDSGSDSGWAKGYDPPPPIAAPEPSSFLLMLLGVGMVGFILCRARFA